MSEHSILTDFKFTEFETLQVSSAEVVSAAEYAWREASPRVDETGEIVTGGLRQSDR